MKYEISWRLRRTEKTIWIKSAFLVKRTVVFCVFLDKGTHRIRNPLMMELAELDDEEGQRDEI